jgi:uncharacterized protein (TIGR02099 family)
MERRKRRWWTWLTTIAAVLVLLAAVVSLAFRFAVDAVPGYRGKVETAVGEAIGRPVSIGSMALVWSRLRPTLEFHDLAVLDRHTRTPLLSVSQLRMGTGFARLLSGERLPSWIDVDGVSADADVDLDGRWSIRGIDLSTTSTEESPLKSLDRIDHIRIYGARFELRDMRLGPQARLQPLTLDVTQATLFRTFDHYTLDAALKPPGEIAASASLRVQLSGEPADIRSWKGQGEAQVDGIRGWPWLSARLPPDVWLQIEAGHAKFDLQVEAGQVKQLDTQVAAAAISALRGTAVLAHFGDVQLQAKAIPAASTATPSSGWNIDITRLALTGTHGAWPASTAQIQLRPEGSSWTVDAHTDFLRLEDLLPWAALDASQPAEVDRISGDLTALRLQLGAPVAAADELPSMTVDAQLHQIALEPKDDKPAISGLDGTLHVETHGPLGDSGRLTLSNATPTLSLPQLFAQPIVLSSISTELDWMHSPKGMLLSTPGFAVKLPGAQAKGHFEVALANDDKTPPKMTLVADLSSDDATQVKRLMPLTWGEKTREWLGRALVKGRVPRGHLVVDGPLVPRNDDHPDGTPWTLELDVAGGTLAFHPDWPAAEDMSAHLSFRDHGLRIASQAARIDGVPVQRVDAEIGDFRDPLLTIDGHSLSDAQAYYRLLRDSPLRTKLAGLLNKTEASGPAAVDLHLEIPLHGDHIEAHATGTVNFGNDDQGAELRVHGLAQPIIDVRGRLAFAKGVTADALSARAFNTPLRAAITERAAADGVLIDTLTADFDVDTQAADGPMTAFVPGWLRGSLDGRSAFQLRLPLSGPENGRVVLASDLQGIHSRLPPPLGKTAEETLPLTVRIGGGAATADGPAPLLVQIAAREDAVRVALRLVNDESGEAHTRGVEVRVGPGDAPTADAEGVVITGEPAELDGPAWAAALDSIGRGNSSGSNTLAFRSMDLRPGVLKLHNTALHDVHVVGTGSPEGVHAELSGATAAGDIDWRREDNGRVRVRLQRLALDAVTNPPPTAKALVDAAEKKDAPDQTAFDPNRAPVLDIDVDALSVGGVDFGRLQLSTFRIDDGQRIQLLKLTGEKLDLDVNGSWLRGSDHSNASISLELHSTDLGNQLAALGYARTVSAKQARFSGSLDWPRAPDGLELAQARGNLELDLEKGSLKAVEPGATGRILGLFNLYALPRRLLLDFRDVAGQGLGFDTLKGSFKLADGQATTDDLDIENPSLKIQIRGRIGLAARDYDQHITVQPDLSTGVTVGATLLGGPIGGGIALVVQKLIGKPLSTLTQFSYHVTGSWDDPHIDKGTPSKPATSATSPANGIPG